MTGPRSQIRTEQHGQAPALTTAVLPQPAAGPSVPGDAERLEAALPACRATPILSCPPRSPSRPQSRHLARLTQSCSPVTRPVPPPGGRPPLGHIMPGSARHTRVPAKSVAPLRSAVFARSLRDVRAVGLPAVPGHGPTRCRPTCMFMHRRHLGEHPHLPRTALAVCPGVRRLNDGTARRGWAPGLGVLGLDRWRAGHCGRLPPLTKRSSRYRGWPCSSAATGPGRRHDRVGALSFAGCGAVAVPGAGICGGGCAA
jgi:hypothetical protein